MGYNFSLSSMNTLFKDAFDKRQNETPSEREHRWSLQEEERKRREEFELYVNSLPALSKGSYEVEALRDVHCTYGTLVAKKGEVFILKNDGMKPSNCSMGTKHYSGCINRDGGMSPSELYVPGIDIKIMKKLEK